MGELLCSYGGVSVRRVVDRSGGVVAEHAHDWPVLSGFVMGAYRNVTGLGALDVSGPSAVLYRAGAAHQNTAGAEGFEQIEVEFDPSWLGDVLLPDADVSRRVGGAAAQAVGDLVRLCAGRPDEAHLRAALRRVLGVAWQAPSPAPSAWALRAAARLREDPRLTVRSLARELGRHPAWLGPAYARIMGESLPAAAARLRVERAARRMRETDEPPATIAVAAGFFDQSHMIRSFRRVLGRTPSLVRGDRDLLRAGA